MEEIKKNKKMKKALVILGIFIALFAVAAYLSIKEVKKQEVQNLMKKNQKMTVQTDTSDETKNWKTYRNDLLGFSFRYPSDNYEFYKGDLEKDEPEFYVKNMDRNFNGYYTFEVSVMQNYTNEEFNKYLQQISGEREYDKISIAGADAYYLEYSGRDLKVYKILQNSTVYGFRARSDDIGEKILSTLQFSVPTNHNRADLIAKKLMADKKVLENLKNLCHYDEQNCGDDFFYDWTGNIDGDAYSIVFLSHLDEESWKNYPFSYSTEIYEVNTQNGQVSREAPFDGSYEYITTIDFE